ncbi:MAG: EAL domain-containing protein [Gammaproteobacteria bacterium]|nr:EAL domain-containing protein [Gammaproteobacteria bacterium]
MKKRLPTDEVITTLLREIGMDAQEIAQRKAFLEFEQTDVKLLTELYPRLQNASQRFVDDFYALLLQFEETHHLISDPHTIKRLKQSQEAYFTELTAGHYDSEYILSRLRVGATHQRIGLEPKWYLGAYRKYLTGLLPELWRLLGDDPDKFLATYHALQKIVFLDMGIAIDTYIQADRRAILDLKHYAEDIITNLPVGLIVLDNALKVQSVNRSFREISGLKDGEDVSGRELEDILPLPGLRQQAQAVLAGRMALHGIDGVLGKKQLHLTITGIQLAEAARLLVVVEDFTEHKQTEDMLARLGRILDSSSNEIYVFDADTLNFLQVNQGALRNLGYTMEEMKAHTPLDIKPLLTRQNFEDLVTPLRQGISDLTMFETMHKRKDGSLYPVEVRIHFARNETRPVFAALIQDITARRRAEEELRLAAVVFEQSIDAVVITDTERRVITANQAFTRMTGYAPEAVIGNTLSILRSGRHDTAFFRAIWEHVTKDGHWQGEVWNRRKSGEIHPVWMSLAAVRNEKGVVTHYIGIMSDIAERKDQEARIEHLAFYDPLTGLPNRALFMDRLNQTLANAERHGQRVAILFMDLNRFKEINDTMGHDAGDLVLTEVARRFQGVLRQADTLTRFGGDEFVIIAGESDQSSTVQIAERLQQALGDPFTLRGQSFSVGTSIGIAFYPEDGKSSDDLLKLADIAMYRAKAAGGGYRFYQPEMSAGLAERMELAQRLGRALKAGQLQLYYQPIVNLQTKAISSAEALLRWNDPEWGWVSPAKFIPVAEERRMMGVLGEWVLKEACRQLKAWQETGLSFPGQLAVNKAVRETGLNSPGRLAINIAAQQLEEAEFVSKTRVIVRAAGLTPNCLALELTESGLMENPERAIGMMGALKTAGFSLSIDDFGTGHSSLMYLKHLPVDKLKIDMSFVRDMIKDSNDYTIVATIIAMARALGLRTVAEGVEEEAQMQSLLALGCDEAQGYYFGHPEPAEVFAQKWLKPTASG